MKNLKKWKEENKKHKRDEKWKSDKSKNKNEKAKMEKHKNEKMKEQKKWKNFFFLEKNEKQMKEQQNMTARTTVSVRNLRNIRIFQRFWGTDEKCSTISRVCCRRRKNIDEIFDDLHDLLQQTTRWYQKCDFFRKKTHNNKRVLFGSQRFFVSGKLTFCW